MNYLELGLALYITVQLHLSMTQQPLLPQCQGFKITLNTPTDSSRQVISPKQGSLPDDTQHSQETNIHALGGIRTCNPSRRAAAGPRGHWDRHGAFIIEQI